MEKVQPRFYAISMTKQMKNLEYAKFIFLYTKTFEAFASFCK